MHDGFDFEFWLECIRSYSHWHWEIILTQNAPLMLPLIKQAKLVQWYIVYSHVLVFYKHLNISILYKI